MNIAALLTVHNRKEKTLDCLRSLSKIIQDIDVYLVDDGCTDGTAEAVKAEFPAVHIIQGNGDLFWSRGMHTAWKEAAKQDYDFYLWLNDDVVLYPNFYEELIYSYNFGKQNCIVSGLIESEEHTILYGGFDRSKTLVQQYDQPQPIYYMNGNVVLVPKSVVDKIGIIDPTFHHDLGDVDYGLTAVENNIPIFSTRIPIALGYRNNITRMRKWNCSWRERFKKLYSPLGANPKINFYFRKKHFGLFNATAYWLFLHLINMLPDKIVKAIWGKKYQ